MNINNTGLPTNCPPFRDTGHHHDTKLLKDYIGDLPGITQQRFDSLSHLALRAQGGGFWSRGPGTTVLRVRDLLRETRSGLQALHPRVVQVVPIGTLDPLLEAVGEVFDAHEASSSKQHPNFLVECRSTNPHKEAIYPPDYDIAVADIARLFRASGLLTSVRRIGETPLALREIQSILDEMERENLKPSGAVTIHQPAGRCEPLVCPDINTHAPDHLSFDELDEMCFMLCRRHNWQLDIVEDEDWRES